TGSVTSRNEQASVQYRAGSTGVPSRQYWSTEQVVLQYQAGGTTVPSRWDCSTKQVGLEYQAGGTGARGSRVRPHGRL
ncbi:MAG: hypothetical protein MJY90_06380, partial [Bacteroidaceae bacterium]|nr:hypothetical protein [Bacteroidaceae bacterium]